MRRLTASLVAAAAATSALALIPLAMAGSASAATTSATPSRSSGTIPTSSGRTQAVVLRHGHVMRRVMLALFPAALWLARYGHGILAAHGGI